jgi:hypothetical protein
MSRRSRPPWFYYENYIWWRSACLRRVRKMLMDASQCVKTASSFILPKSLLKNFYSLYRSRDCMTDVLMGFHRSTFSNLNTEFNSDLAPCDFWAFPTMKMELRGKKFRSDQRSAALFSEKWVERCKKCIACHGRYFEEETVIAPPQSSDSE